LNFRPVLRTLVAVVCCAGLACAAAPASTRSRTIPADVTLSGISVGGLTAEPARQRVVEAFRRPLQIETPDGLTYISPARAGSKADVDAAVTAAFSATPRSDIAVPVAYSRTLAARIAAALAKRFDRVPVGAKVIGANAQGPIFSPAKAGREVDTRTMQTAIGQLLDDGTRTPLRLLMHSVTPKRTVARFGPVIVVTRGTNTLRLYNSSRLVRTFRVATGQTIYPTPSGLWHIMDKQRDPWWYPPTYDAWAQGLKPVPPGPDNPLGTRWMGLNAPGVGIHGTDAPASIGYSASHGCIRMQVPDAEWLFEHVHVGTPVVIL
jgi:lipoprotein-anchoring transpeptidase ErfK/SrfK